MRECVSVSQICAEQGHIHVCVCVCVRVCVSEMFMGLCVGASEKAGQELGVNAIIS